MSANEIVKKLRLRANTFSTTPECDKTLMEDAADLIESLQAQCGRLIDLAGDWKEAADKYHAGRNDLQKALSASQRMEKAAVEFIKYLDRNYSGYMAEDERFAEWRGPVAGKGDAARV